MVKVVLKSSKLAQANPSLRCLAMPNFMDTQAANTILT